MDFRHLQGPWVLSIGLVNVRLPLLCNPIAGRLAKIVVAAALLILPDSDLGPVCSRAFLPGALLGLNQSHHLIISSLM